MSWLEKLYKTYENNLSHIGDPQDKIPLVPICHTTQNAQITIVIDGAGNFSRAHVLPKTDARTIIPATEKAAGRSGRKPLSYPLCDKLQYVAGDFVQFGGEVTSGFAEDPREPHSEYIKQLSDWCTSSYGHPKVCAVKEYVVRGRVVDDLVNAGILPVDNHGKLAKAWTGGKASAPEIFRSMPSDSPPENAFVRFAVEIPGDPQSALWTDASAWDSWINYYSTVKTVKGLCYLTGRELLLADQHPAKIRNGGDKAKLISSNDSSDFTFLGRFTSADEACGVGFEVTQKAHSALRWLIPRQGYRDGDQAVVAWAVSGKEIPGLLADTASLIGLGSPSAEVQGHGYTAQETGIALSRLLAGYSAKLTPTEDVIVMALDSATPGRMAIRYYRELRGSEFLERVQTWHAGCSWRQQYAKDKVFIGAPAPRDIAEAAYGRRLDERLRQATVERLLPSIVDGSQIPADLVDSCIRRTSNKNGMELWEWEKALGIACALFKYQHKERGYTMALDRDRKTRDYLYGRLLALAEHLEGRALYVAGERRETNAGRLMQRFADRPYSTWRIIETSLTPYKTRLRTKRGAFLHNVETEMDEVEALFNTDDFLSDRRLSGEFLLGYHCQRSALKGSPADEPETESKETELEDSIKEIR